MRAVKHLLGRCDAGGRKTYPGPWSLQSAGNAAGVGKELAVPETPHTCFRRRESQATRQAWTVKKDSESSPMKSTVVKSNIIKKKKLTEVIKKKKSASGTSLDSTQSLFSLSMPAWLPDSHVSGNTYAVFPGRRVLYRPQQRSLHFAGTTDLGRFSAHQHRIYQGDK
ncbi:hypothetical protein NDU88_001740 [Pleurodeles waltl]|uniref:Uncharacterized protein n=1 Tax=Pleurodeles waltl TaxID=8319 RepID=A0AAV7T037_PLEWA|nr:hypothetical protein NDU88_001740 [Pleurodeles waltl]